jgi:hypothetical protein
MGSQKSAADGIIIIDWQQGYLPPKQLSCTMSKRCGSFGQLKALSTLVMKHDPLTREPMEHIVVQIREAAAEGLNVARFTKREWFAVVLRGRLVGCSAPDCQEGPRFSTKGALHLHARLEDQTSRYEFAPNQPFSCRVPAWPCWGPILTIIEPHDGGVKFCHIFRCQ